LTGIFTFATIKERNQKNYIKNNYDYFFKKTSPRK
jgi:hypothetical protein